MCIRESEFPKIKKDGYYEIVQCNMNANDTMARWNKSIEEPEIHVEFSWPGYNGLGCGFFFDCDGLFRFYYSNNENNDTVEVNFPVINHTLPSEGGNGGDGIGGAVSDALPGFGLFAGIGALALAAVGASRFSREE